MNLEQQIEAVLFYKAEPMKKTALAAFFKIDPEQLDASLQSLGQNLQNRGIQLVSTENEVQLVTSAQCSDLIESLRKDELKNDIGKAGAETLAIVLYKGPISRAEIDRIRGVNSTFILRNLLVRGLIERKTHPTDQRSFMYEITPELLNHLGVTSKDQLSDYEDIMNTIDNFEREQTELESEVNT